MDLFLIFFLGFFFSFIGSIPPGSINLSVLQLAMKGLLNAALRFALAATIIEFIYAYIAVEFQLLITSSKLVQANFHIISALVLIFLGLFNLFMKKNPGKLAQKLEVSGFRKGILISLANPLAIPFWIAITVYIEGNGWINLSRETIFIYITGISLGTLSLLSVVAFLSAKVAPLVKNPNLIRKIPGIVLLGLGLYSLIDFLVIYLAK